MNTRAREKIGKARRTHSSNKRVNMAAYRVSGYNEDTQKYISFDGVIKLTDNTIGTLFRRHKDLAALSKINLSIRPM